MSGVFLAEIDISGWAETILTVLTVVVAMLMTFFILLQEGKGGGLTALGGTKAAGVEGVTNPIRRATGWLAGIMFVLLIVLGVIRKPAKSGGFGEDKTAAATTTAENAAPVNTAPVVAPAPAPAPVVVPAPVNPAVPAKPAPDAIKAPAPVAPAPVNPPAPDVKAVEPEKVEAPKPVTPKVDIPDPDAPKPAPAPAPAESGK